MGRLLTFLFSDKVKSHEKTVLVIPHLLADDIKIIS